MLLALALFVPGMTALYADEVILKNGNVLSGTITVETEKTVTIKVKVGTISIPKEQIAALRKGDSLTPLSPGSSTSSGIVPPVNIRNPVARVGPGGISGEEFELYLLKRANALGATPATLTEEEKKRALNEAIEDEIVFQCALADGILEEAYIRRLIAGEFRSSKTTAKIEPKGFAEEELKRYYDDHPEEFRTPDEALVSVHDFPGVRSEEAAAKEREKVLTDSDAAWRSGGWVKRGDQILQALPELNILFDLGVGEISPALKTPTGTYSIYRVDEHREGRLKTFEESRERARFLLSGEKQRGLDAELAGKLKSGSEELDENALVEAALNEGWHRRPLIRLRIVNEYLSKQGVNEFVKGSKKRDDILPDLRTRMKVEILQSGQ
ncbi:MAG: hypothetical protein A2Z34_03170 [Planctomycetes bacterium RBG_16_59_8]|nr:MAG: hypothetical protein A2Z34_03170 [Planctomycetes bacterium RBG_16_59_8]